MYDIPTIYVVNKFINQSVVFNLVYTNSMMLRYLMDYYYVCNKLIWTILWLFL